MNAQSVLPWQADQWDKLMRSRARLPQALLLHGPPGIGKRRFCNALAQALLCAQTLDNGQACGSCHPCRLFAEGTHPDHLCVRVEEDSTQIRIEQIRELSSFVFLSASMGAVKLASILGAERMNSSTANALLKTLEEPPPGTLILMTSDQISALPATVRSRCHKLRFPLPERAAASAWLRAQAPEAATEACLDAAGGAPLTALADGSAQLELGARLQRSLAQLSRGELSSLECTEQFKEMPLHTLLILLDRLLRETLAARLASVSPVTAGRSASTRDPAVVSQSADPDALFALHAEVIAHRSRLHIKLNPQLVLDDLFGAWAVHCAPLRLRPTATAKRAHP